MSLIETVWTDDRTLCLGLKVGSWRVVWRRIPHREIVAVRTLVLCCGSSEGYGPLIEVTVEDWSGRRIDRPVHTEVDVDVEWLRALLRETGAERADAFTRAAAAHGPRMLMDGDLEVPGN
ncbi:MAG TPA: hypothetical protein VK997_12995 [Deferrisomatales bacterium]|nr:hypothetical protein [Deferrisomatales bacterium]